MGRTTPAVLTYRRADGTPERFSLQHDVTTLGRSPSCSVVIPLPTISRLHARVELQYDRYVLFDAGSANGTFVNGKRIEQGYQLSTGDTIWLGDEQACLLFSDPEETLTIQAASLPPALFIDEDARHVAVYGVPVQLSPLEYDLLLHLAHHPGTVCTRQGCFLAVWGQPYDHATCEDALNACISKLRRNLRVAAESAGREPPPIRTIQRIGFRLDADVTFAAGREHATALTQKAREA